MKPLVICVNYDRLDMLKVTLGSIVSTTKPGEIELVVVDNGSRDGSQEWLGEWLNQEEGGRYVSTVTYHQLPENVGCPKALNLAIREHRQSGQPVVKIDNDVEILTSGWVELLSAWEDASKVAMVIPYYEGVESQRQIGCFSWKGREVLCVSFVPGHMCWHTGRFMDLMGYFDVLSEDHLYGFEDKLMSDKALLLGKLLVVDKMVSIRNLQRNWDYFSYDKDVHVAAMRPLYECRKREYLVSVRDVQLGPGGGLLCFTRY